MRTKSLEGWKRKPGQLASAWANATKMSRKGVHPLMAMGMILLVGTTMIRILRNDRLGQLRAMLTQLHSFLVASLVACFFAFDGATNSIEARITARLPGTIADEYYFHCDRSQIRTDVCNLRGDIRLETRNKTKVVVLYVPQDAAVARTEKLKPYTRKWEDGSMRKVTEITLMSQIANPNRKAPKCDVRHTVPGVLFSTGGYTGNLYHEFNDGVIPLFITSQHLRREVVLIATDYKHWWWTKYQEVLAQISNYEVIDLESDKRVHCFSEIEAGLHIHGELSVNPNRMPNRETIGEFRELLNQAYKPKFASEEETIRTKYRTGRPRLTIIVRETTRRFMNLDEIVKLGGRLGYRVSLLQPRPETELKKIFWLLNATDVLLGVHGAALTHFLFMRPGTVFIQVVPLGTDWAANEYYGEPAEKLGMHYLKYKISPEESSLSEKFNATNPVLTNPKSVTAKGWGIVKEIYLEGQDVRPSLPQMRSLLSEAKRVVRDLRAERPKPRAER